jgi:hypothetical protein
MKRDDELDKKATQIERMVDDIFTVMNALKDTTTDRVAALYSNQQQNERPGEQDQKGESEIS